MGHNRIRRQRETFAYRFAMPVPTQVPTTRNQWIKERDRLRKKFDKAGVPNDIVPNFDDDWDNQVYDQNWDWEGLRGGRSSWYARPLEYEGKGQPGIAQRHRVTRSGIPINYLIHHDDDGQINGILSHFPEGSSHEKPGAITVTVHPYQRNQGIGRRLAEESEKRFGVDLDSQQYTPLGYEMYRKIKNDRGQEMPDIFNKPVKQANSAYRFAYEDDVYERMRRDGLLKRLEKEFHAWYNEHGNERLNWAGRGPLGNWRQIENFMKVKYPEAHKGITTGYEEAGKLMDTGYLGNGSDYCPTCHGSGTHMLRTNEACVDCGGSGTPDKPLAYQTGSDAIKQYGYDPKEVAAGMLLLHNRTHPHRSDMEGADTERLVDIARNRSEMQRNYEQQQASS